jgi:RHS repeat-associated protein
VYFSQRDNGAVRVVTPQGIIRTIAGTGVKGYSGDGGRALAAQFRTPWGLAITPDGALIIADREDHRVRRLGPALPGFDAGGHLIASEDGSALYQFSAEGQHLQTLSALTGVTLYSFEYDSGNRLIGITDGNGLETTIERDGTGDPQSITGPFGQQTSLALDANGYLASVTNPASEAHSFVTDSLGLLEEFITPESDTTRVTYDPEGRLTQHVDPAGRVTTLTRTEGDDFLEVEFERGTRTSVYRIEADPSGAVAFVATDPAGHDSEAVEGADGTTNAVTPDSTTRSSTEGPDPRFGIQAPVITQAALELPSGLTSVLSGGRRVELTDTLDPLSLVSVLDTVVLNGRVYRSAYVAATRTLTSTTPEGRETVSVLDSLDRLVSHEVPGLDSTAFTYDGQGLLTAASQGPRAWSFDYDVSGRLQATTDPLSHTDSLFYDLADRVRKQVLADGDSIVYGYDANGNLMSLAPPGRPAHAFAYNASGLDSIYDPPDVAGLSEDRTFYTYNTNRELVEILRPDSASIDFAYDTAGRVDAVTFPRGTIDYAYDSTTGQLSNVTAPGSEGLSFGYDGVLPTSETWTGTVAGTVAFDYDADLRLSGLAVSGDTIPYGYDDDGLLTQAGELVLVRDSLNGLLKETALDSVLTQLTYNTFGEPAADSAWVGTTLVFARTYTRDDLGRITEVVDFADGVTTVWGYGYDEVGRLQTVTQDSVAYASYEYDANGNRLTRTSLSGVETGVYDTQDRLTGYDGATYTYTPAGELESKIVGADTTRYEYDALGNVIEVDLPDGTLVEYVVDGRNRRVGRKANGQLVQGLLYGDQLNPVAELDSTGAVVSRFVYGSKANVPDYIVNGGDTLRVISDHLGSVRVVVNAGTGAVTQKLSYDAFGGVLQDTNPGFQPFGFAGGIWDEATGLVRFGARDYDAGPARWTAKDPTFFAGGSNLFDYAYGDPLNHVDPSGQIAIIPIVLGGWALAELGLAAADFLNLFDTVIDPCSTAGDIALAAGLVGLSVVTPGGGYASADELVQIARQRRLDVSALERVVVSSSRSTEGGHRQIVRLVDSVTGQTQAIYHEVTDAAGRILHRDLKTIRDKAGYLWRGIWQFHL